MHLFILMPFLHIERDIKLSTTVAMAIETETSYTTYTQSLKEVVLCLFFKSNKEVDSCSSISALKGKMLNEREREIG